MVEVVKHEQLDLLHVHYAIPHASAAYMAKKILAEEDIHVPVVTTLHGTDITLLGKDASFEPVISFAINKSDKVTAVSSSLKNDTYKLFGVNKDIEVIPNFIRIDQANYVPNEELRQSYAPNGEKIIAHISNFRPVKRIPDIIEVFNLVKKEVKAKLVLVGDGPDRSKVSQMCREYGICDDVLLVGKLKNPTEVLSISDLFMLPSEQESFGLAALEAMAAGVPVVSSNTGGIPELNRHGVSGMMSNLGDIEEMAKHCVYLLDSEKRLEKFKKQALKRAKEFDISKVLARYEKIYKEALEEVKAMNE